MEISYLQEYRCSCGKLLFKGFLLLSLVEIKCKRCAKTTVFGALYQGADSPAFALRMSTDGLITDYYAYGANITSSNPFGYAPVDLVGKDIGEVFPSLKYIAQDSFLAERPFSIGKNVFVCRDGSKKSLDSYFACDYNKGSFSGYQMLNWITRES
jgi:hypothetical protein